MVEYEWVRIARDLERRIRSGEIPPGGRLENERALADVHQVSPGTVRRAVRDLRERGLVETLAAKGTYVVDPLPPVSGEASTP
ncbi:winged helix-turn-helix domain-containing protein [Streptomyces caniscabiei]|uniref:winged helix-turn-helix domain-containing protein n=1 Tax=Streptomyces caniscabiei TaxID=2746961 RepID=UPI0029BCAC0D|nr:winged helix-turn-helix domain-containing protein [Streptomyces caniscabiei]MDX2604198.1 winged helix-turn-helix domain-containing protein [Streptomyces caniscabiei]MDX2739221.1 winged helix-turn-helix domain-containing protein [Streptomyces caniscabiei]MDX2780856.1 winged helix-turn-helix domain-containing protein [Streptomyces caniscabiei]